MKASGTRRRPGARPRSVACFCMPETGHFQRLRSLIAGLAGRGISVHVFTHRKFAPQVEQAGGRFIDLFLPYPLESADNTSIPVPCRYVTFAAKYAEPIRADVERLGASLVIHDTFAVIGRVVANLLGLPRVNVCSGHNVTAARFLAVLREDPRVRVADECVRAADVLRESCGIADASPFSYVSPASPDLNLYCEPPEFLEMSARPAFEPLAFFGSLPAPEERDRGVANVRSRFGAHRAPALNVYVSFGTIVWRSYAAEALRALQTLAKAFARLDKVRAVISLGGATLSAGERASLIRPNVSVEAYVDQWALLREADVFVTHHGMNSTHEAIFHRVPMISYPFFWDQPALAEKCRTFGLALPLAAAPRGAFDVADVDAVLTRLSAENAALRGALTRARAWERAVVDNRPAVFSRIAALAR